MYENNYVRTYVPTQWQAPSNSIQWVQGVAGAKGYMIAPNSSVLLMDSEETKFYIKSADASGMPNLRIFEYTEISPVKADIPTEKAEVENYCTKEEMDEIRAQIADILARLEEKKPATRKKEVAENE